MIWIYPEQLSLELINKKKIIYVLYGNDLYLLQSNHENLLNILKKQYNTEHIYIKINNCFDWNEVFNLCRKKSLFSQQTILSLQFPKNYSLSKLYKHMVSLSPSIHHECILILFVYTSQYLNQSNNMYFKYFNKIGIIIQCAISNHVQLEIWIKNQSKNMHLTIEKLSCQLLCYYYENNTMLLKQILQHLSILYPDGNLSFNRVKNIITDSAYFNYNHWLEAVLIGKKQRANRILKKIDLLNVNLITLLHKVQREILIIIQIKYNIKHGSILYTLFKKYNIYSQYHRMILSQALRRLHFYQLHQAILLLGQMELKYFQNYMYVSKLDFESLTEILCYNGQIARSYVDVIN